MSKDRPPDPVDLMLDRKFEEAANAYRALYVKARQNKDDSICPDLLMGLHYCVAGMKKEAPSAPDVEATVRAHLTEHKVTIDKQAMDHLQIASAMVKKGRERGERSVAGVESEKKRRWTEEKS